MTVKLEMKLTKVAQQIGQPAKSQLEASHKAAL